MFRHQRGHHLAQRRTMFEAVARASAQQPDIIVSGMAVDDEVIVRGILILTNPRLEQRSIFQRGKPEGDVLPH